MRAPTRSRSTSLSTTAWLPRSRRSGGSSPSVALSSPSPRNGREARSSGSRPTSRTNGGRLTSLTGRSQTARTWRSSTSSTTTPGFWWARMPGSPRRAPTWWSASTKPLRPTGSRHQCSPTTPRCSPVLPEAGPVRHRDRARRSGDQVSALHAEPSPDLRQSRAVSPDREAVAAKAAPGGGPHRAPGQAGLVPRLLQHLPSPPGDRSENAGRGLRRPAEGEPLSPWVDRSLALPSAPGPG